jgi:NTP pyrophosphatase (non-canonical NTP hydrolase)
MQNIANEMARADDKYGWPASAQETLGVLLEEFHELREAIHQNNLVAVRNEAIQVAAVAARLAEACELERRREDGAPQTAFGKRSGF